MPDRQGETSIFPGSLDQFSIKNPYDPSKPLGNQAQNALERAAHFNAMFDAMFNIEQTLFGQVGSSLVSRYSSDIASGDIFGSNLLMAYTSLSTSMSAEEIALTATVPSGFGNTPFANKGFSIGHSLYVSVPAGSGGTEGIWANTNWGDMGPSNSTMLWVQPFVMIAPVSGRTFNVIIKNLKVHSSATSFDGSFSDSLNSNGLTQALSSRNGWSGIQQETRTAQIQYITGIYRLRLRNDDNGGSRRYAQLWPTSTPDSDDAYVEWGEILDRTADDISGTQVYMRAGPMVRCTGTLSSANFYCVAIGDIPYNAPVSGDGGKYGRILRVQGTDLTYESHSNVNWGVPGSVLTDLGSGYKDFGGTNIRYRLKVVGNQVSVESKTGSGSWSTLYGPYTDPSPLPGKAIGMSKNGIFVQGFETEADRWVEVAGPITVTPLDAGLTALTVNVELLFSQIGPDSNITTQSG